MFRRSSALVAMILTVGLAAGTALAAAPSGSVSHGSNGGTKVTGHYKGKNKAGRQMSFDVVGRGNKLRVKDFAVDVDTECWNDFNNDGESDRLLAHITGFDARLKRNNTFDIYYAPDDDTEFQFTGKLAKGKAKVNVIVGGTFNPDGTPSTAGPYQCDSWGAKYSARAKR